MREQLVWTMKLNGAVMHSGDGASVTWHAWTWRVIVASRAVIALVQHIGRLRAQFAFVRVYSF